MLSHSAKFLLAFVLGTLLSASHAQADFLYVDPSGMAPGGHSAYTTIQAAVNAAPANSTIMVDAGTYSEDVTIPQLGITLEGAQAGVNPVPGRSGPESTLSGTITITGASVTVDGFTVNANSLWAIEIGGVNAPSAPATNSVIQNNIVYNAGPYGIQIGAEGSGPGVMLVSLYSLVQDNLVTGHNITLFHTSNNTIQDNFVTDTAPGGTSIQLYYANDNSILGNRVDYGADPSDPVHASAIWLRGSNGNLGEDNFGYNDGQPAIQAYEGSSGNTFLNNNFSPNSAPVPEPASVVLLLSGLVSLALKAGRARKKASC